MRPLTKNEKLLGAVFAGIVFLMLVLVGTTFLRRTLDAGRKEQAALRSRLVELRDWEARRPVLERRAEWLAQHPLPVWDEQNSAAELVGDLQNSVAAMSIEINNQRLLDPVTMGDLREAGVQLNLKASTEELVRWLHQIQRPGDFVSVRQINLRSDSDKTNLRAELSLVKHYRMSANEAPADSTAPALPAAELPPGAPGREPPGGPDDLSQPEPPQPDSTQPSPQQIPEIPPPAIEAPEELPAPVPNEAPAE